MSFKYLHDSIKNFHKNLEEIVLKFGLTIPNRKRVNLIESLFKSLMKLSMYLEKQNFGVTGSSSTVDLIKWFVSRIEKEVINDIVFNEVLIDCVEVWLDDILNVDTESQFLKNVYSGFCHSSICATLVEFGTPSMYVPTSLMQYLLNNLRYLVLYDIVDNYSIIFKVFMKPSGIVYVLYNIYTTSLLIVFSTRVGICTHIEDEKNIYKTIEQEMCLNHRICPHIRRSRLLNLLNLAVNIRREFDARGVPYAPFLINNVGLVIIEDDHGNCGCLTIYKLFEDVGLTKMNMGSRKMFCKISTLVDEHEKVEEVRKRRSFVKKFYMRLIKALDILGQATNDYVINYMCREGKKVLMFSSSFKSKLTIDIVK